MTFTKEFYVSLAESEKLERLCEVCSSDLEKDSAIFDEEVVFENGNRMSIQVISTTQPAKEPCWVQGVLLSPEGHELGSTDVGESFLGEYCVSSDGDDYKVIVKTWLDDMK